MADEKGSDRYVAEKLRALGITLDPVEVQELANARREVVQAEERILLAWMDFFEGPDR